MITKEKIQELILKGNEHGIVAEGKFKGCRYIVDDNKITNYICDFTENGYEKYLIPIIGGPQIKWSCKNAYIEAKKKYAVQYAINKTAKATAVLIEIGSQFEDTYKSALKTQIALNPNIPGPARELLLIAIEKLDSEFDKRIAMIDSEKFAKDILEKIFN